METTRRPFSWARRVEQPKIRRLYETDARGIVDDEQIDDVGYAIFARCRSILVATEAAAGRARCMGCSAIVERTPGEGIAEVLACGECGWTTTWGEYHKSYKRKQLHGGGATPVFAAFVQGWPLARTPRDKLLAIDAVLHACHVSLQHEVASRPSAVNLIEGTMRQVLAFLDEIAYSDLSTPGLQASQAELRETMADAARWWAGRGKAKAKT